MSTIYLKPYATAVFVVLAFFHQSLHLLYEPLSGLVFIFKNPFKNLAIEVMIQIKIKKKIVAIVHDHKFSVIG